MDLDKAKEESGDKHGTDSGTYAMAIGSLMYVALATRPDTSYAVNKLVSYTSNPKLVHWTAIKKVFRYLKGSQRHSLSYNATQHQETNVTPCTPMQTGDPAQIVSPHPVRLVHVHGHKDECFFAMFRPSFQGPAL